MDIRDKQRIIVRSLIDFIVVRSRRRTMRKITLRPLNDCPPLRSSDLPLIFVVRNESNRIGSFLNHYRRLGVTRFLAVDDQSSDGTGEQLLREKDVTVFHSNVRYGAARRGQLWRQSLAEQFGLNRWYINVDIDEFLIYDGMDRHPLPDLIRKLESMRLKRIMAPMVDLYPEGDWQAVELHPGVDPWTVANCIDAKDYFAWFARMCVEVNGGPLFRCFREKGVRTKFPLIYWDRRTFPVRTVHAPLPYWRNYDPPLGALLHFKLLGGLKEKCLDGIADDQRYRNALSFRQIYDRLKEDSSIPLVYDGTRRYDGPATLVQYGFMKALDWS